jgi:hypothetical protein
MRAWPATIILAGVLPQNGVLPGRLLSSLLLATAEPEFGRTSSYDTFPTTVVPLFVPLFCSSSRGCGNGVTGRCTVSTTPETWMFEIGRERLDRASCYSSRIRRLTDPLRSRNDRRIPYPS